MCCATISYFNTKIGLTNLFYIHEFWQIMCNLYKIKYEIYLFFVNKKSEGGKCYIDSIMTENLQSFPSSDFLRHLISSIKNPRDQRSSSVVFIVIVISLKNEDDVQYGNVTGK